MSRSIKVSASVTLACAVFLVGGVAQARMSDAQVRQAMIGESLASYPGNCPCPYNADRAGRSCGRRSAYSRPGGYAPLCYARDISKAQVEAYRHGHGG